MRLLSIDPGKHSIAWAVFDDGILQRCGLIRAKSVCDLMRGLDGCNPRADCLVIEKPQVYQQRLLKGNPNDLVDVALTAGMAAALVGSTVLEVEFVPPRQWKNTRPKSVCNKLTIKTLNSEELQMLNAADCPKSLMHNIVDAVGIGLWKLGRR